MSRHFSLFIDGLAFWAPAAPSWTCAQPLLRQAGTLVSESASTLPSTPMAPIAPRPAPSLLTPNERRRASDSVLVALQVASAACAASGHDPARTASVFTSAHGDLPITDALCRTLAADPRLLSPTRFHHSVHNAASGYWAIASGCTAASTALAAGEHSFAAGLLEAASQCVADGVPVLLVACDTEACGPLVSVNRSRGLLGVALLLAPAVGANTGWQLDLHMQSGAATAPALGSALAQSLQHNATADALPLFEALSAQQPASLALPLHAHAHLALHLGPAAQALPADSVRGHARAAA